MMNLDIQLSLVENFGFHISDITATRQIDLPENLAEGIKLCKFQDVYDIASKILDDTTQSDEMRILAACLKKESHFHLSNSIKLSFNEVEGDENDEDPWNEEDDYEMYVPDYLDEEEKKEWIKDMEERNERMKEQDKKYLKNIKLIKTWTQEETSQKMLNFFLENSSLAEKGLPRGSFKKTLNEYYEELGYIDYKAPEPVRAKFSIAKEYCESELTRLFNEYEDKHIDIWKDDIMSCAKEHGLKKVTKGYVIEYFKTHEIKVSPSTIDRIKALI